MVLGLTHFSQRSGEGAGVPVLDTFNGEELVHVQPNVAVAIGNRSPESTGSLYISTKKIVWLSDVDRDKGYAVDFLSLSLHAVSRDPEAYSSPCIYAQIETESDDLDSGDSDSESNEVVDLSRVKEMRLIPSDPNHLDTLFQIFCECAELNPEPVDEADQEHNWIFSAEQLAEDVAEDDNSEWDLSPNPANSIGHSNGDHDVARRVLELQIDDQRFEDPEEMEQERPGHHHQ